MSNKILDFSKENGLVLCQNPVEARNNEEKLYISEVSKLKAYAVLFRRFFRNLDDQAPYHSEPAVCIFKEEDIEFNSEEHIQLHAKLWSAGRNEIYIITGRTRVDIINARKPAKGENGRLSLSELKLAEVIKGHTDERFSAYLFGSGTFWEQTEFQDKFDENSSPYIHLLTYLLAVRKNFLSNKAAIDLLPETVDKLLIVSILVKFLEEIKDDDGKHALKSIYRRLKVASFAEAVEKRLTLDIFNELASEFNGKIFDNFTDTEKKKIKNTDLLLLSHFLTAKINLKTSQIFLWEQYNFNHLPAEVISAIYENFIQAEAARKNGQAEKGVVYTPIHLVNFLVDEVMPLDKPSLFKNERFRVLDPTCGSGVFLVAAYKRLLQWWAINNSTADNVQYPSAKVAKKILEENIYGVDVKETAVLISILGLTTALLDKLSPKEIWNQLRFSDLRAQNLQCSNFFKWAANSNFNDKFDIVIGNPPFNPETGVKKSNILVPSLLQKLNIVSKNIPRSNFALHFFEASLSLGKKVCMIIPSSIMLYDKTAHDYRKTLFETYNLSDIFDFTHLRRDLFHKSADTPVVAIIVENKESLRQKINHTVVKRMISSENKIRFEIDYYDRHWVPFEWATDASKQFVWKTNLLGGGRLYHLIYRLGSLPTLRQFLDKKEKEFPEQWIYSSGYKVGGNTEKRLAPFINEGNKIAKVYEDGTFEISKEGERTNQFEFFPNPVIYTPPVIVFDQVFGKKNIPVALVEAYHKRRYLYFNRDFVGIHAPKKEVRDLIRIHDFIKIKFRDLCRFYVLVQSGSCMVLTETEINKRDIDSIPFPDNEEYLKLSTPEKIIQDDVLNYYMHSGKAISKNSAGSVLHKKASAKHLDDFGNALCNNLNLIYAKSNKSWQIAGYHQTASFTIYQIGFGSFGSINKAFDSDELSLADLLKESTSNRGAIFNRVIRIYKHVNGYDCIYLIKPSALRYWIKSIALRDCDDTIVDLKNGGF
jgi:type I restriction-modification system DNA methylase subunit